ncbi:tubulin-like doman-containing protein [Maridesulfovibrio sp.]|uniref:tubulin-like doman-containing protein n=1 Tax=Maridesulfovibrio sp. TaxID=2795000 RepID=UPI0039F0A09D
MKMKKLLNPINKTLVVGLGGTGKETLIQIKRRLFEEGYDETAFQPYVKLLSLDFDPAPVRTSTRENIPQEILLDTSESAAISSSPIFNRLKTLNEPVNRHFYESWYPDMDNNFIRMGAHRAGAAQWRPLGRMGYYEQDQVIQQRLESKLKSLQGDSASDNRQINSEVVVYIVSSISGGTGSGLLLDTAYFMRSLNPDMRIVGMLLLPGIYSEHDIQGRLFSNTYAMLKEMTAFMGQTQEFRANYPNGRPIKGQILKDSPFDHIFLHDSTLGPDRMASSPQTMAELIAESIYLEVGNSYLNQTQSSALTNVSNQSGGTAMDQVAEKSFFNTMGNVTFLLPSVSNLNEYWANRAILEIYSEELDGVYLGGKDSVAIEALSQESEISAEGLEKKIDKITNEALNKSVVFTNPFIIHAGQAMGPSLVDIPVESVRQHIEQYVKALLDPNLENKGEMPTKPHRLPDNMLGEEGAEFRSPRTIPVLIDKIDEEIQPLLDAISQPYCQLKSARKFSSSLDVIIGRYRNAARKHRESAAEFLLGSGGLQENIFAELEQFIGSVPRSDREGALSHWAGRFFHQLSHTYREHISKLRVYIFAADRLSKLNDGLKELILKTEKTFLGEPADTNLLESSSKRAMEKAVLGGEGRRSLVVRTLANEEYYQRSWDYVKPRLQEAVPEFVLKLQAALQDQKLSGNEIYDQAKSVVVEIIKELKNKSRNSWNAQNGGDVFDPCKYIDFEDLKAELGRARHDHFVDNSAINMSAQKMVYALFPDFGPGSSEQDSGVFYRRFKDCISNNMDATSTSLETYSMSALGDDEPGRIVVRHLSMNHPPFNLKDISYYYAAYCKQGKNRALSHIHKEYVKFPEIVMDSQVEQHITCGNPNCDYDITHLPRTVLVCPECNRPILSRCGNPECPEDFLHEHADIKSGKERIFCPTCKKRMKTRWWYCNDHNQLISIESNYCKLCLQEYAAGKRPFARVSRSEEVVPHFPCPGCLETGIEHPFKITFGNVYEEVSDENVSEALSIYLSSTTPQGRCPKCDSLLLPVCPYHKPNDDEIPHFVQRGEGSTGYIYDSKEEAARMEKELGKPHERFFCTSDQDHAQLCIKECSFCGMPLKEDADYCPRCKRTRDVEVNKLSEDQKEECQKILKHHNQRYFGFKCEEEQKSTCSSKDNLEPSSSLTIQEKGKIRKPKEGELPAGYTVTADDHEKMDAFEIGKEEGYGG